MEHSMSSIKKKFPAYIILLTIALGLHKRTKHSINYVDKLKKQTLVDEKAAMPPLLPETEFPTNLTLATLRFLLVYFPNYHFQVWAHVAG